MKNFKKLGYTLALTLSLLLGGLLFSPSHKVFADDITDMSQICVPPYKSVSGTKQHAIDGWLTAEFTDRAHITATYKTAGNCASPAGYNSSTFFGTRTFNDIFKDISGQDGTLLLTDSNGDSNVDYGEAVGSGGDDTQINHFGGNLDNLMKDDLGGHDKIVSNADLQANLQKVQIILGLESDKVGYGCTSSAQNENFVLKDGNPPYWDCVASSKITSDSGFIIGAGNFSGLDKFNVTYTTTVNNGLIAVKSVFPDQQSSRTFVYCGGPKVFKNDNCNGNLTLKANKDDITKLGTGTKTFTITDGSKNVDVVVAGSENATSLSSDGSVAVGGAEDPCVQNSHIGMEWLLCPFINSTIGATDKLNDQIKGQLNFEREKLLTADVHKSWSIFKDIVSALVVIIMLVMVISQAIGEGPFSAYTIKKILPKLVIAVIAMQLSWDICYWLIGVANDAGNGIGQIIAAPFGGVNNLQLAQLLEHLNDGWLKLTSVSLLAMLFASATIAVLFLPGIALVAFSAFVTIVIALVCLLFRNALIMILVMLSPLAILSWVLPGTQKWWKMWSENFSKLLILFPLMMAIIYGGRAFAYIAGGLGGSGFLDFVMVLVGFFVPYSILPKAFKWGGSLMRMSYANTVDNGIFKKIRDSGNRVIGKDFNEYWKGRMARELYDPYDKTVKPGIFKLGGIPMPIMKGRLAGRMGSQHFMPTAHGRAQTLREGSKWSGERREDAKAYNRRRFELALEHGYAVDENDQAFTPDGEAYESNGVMVAKDRATGRERVLGTHPDENGNSKVSYWGRGTGAAKQALVDMTALDNAGGNDRINKDAVEQLIQTSSNPEIEHAVISFGKMKGKRVFDADSDDDHLGGWDKEIGGSNALYPETAKANYDKQVHLKKNAYARNRNNDDLKLLGRTMSERLDDLGDTPEARRIKQRHDVEGKRTIMADHHQSLYNIAHDMGIEHFGTQSLGFWQRQLRHAKDAEAKYGDSRGSVEIGKALAARFADMVRLGEAGASTMRPLIGGEKGAVVDEILALDPSNIKGWKAVEAPDGSLDWKAEYKTVADFANEAHHPEKTIKTGAARPPAPPTREYLDKDYYATQEWREENWEKDAETAHQMALDENDRRDGVPVGSRVSRPADASAASATRPGGAVSTDAEGTATPTESDATRQAQGNIQLNMPTDLSVKLHPESLGDITEAVSRGVTQGMSSATINVGGGPRSSGEALNEEERNELRRIHSALVRLGDALSPEQRARYHELRSKHPEYDPESGEDVPVGGA